MKLSICIFLQRPVTASLFESRYLLEGCLTVLFPHEIM